MDFYTSGDRRSTALVGHLDDVKCGSIVARGDGCADAKDGEPGAGGAL